MEDRLIQKLSDIAVDIAEIKKDLSYHIKRTDLLEEQIKPIRRHVIAVQGVAGLISVLSLLLGILKMSGVI